MCSCLLSGSVLNRCSICQVIVQQAPYQLDLSPAEKFALKGKRVLVLLTDMTNFSDAMKEIAITMEQVQHGEWF